MILGVPVLSPEFYFGVVGILLLIMVPTSVYLQYRYGPICIDEGDFTVQFVFPPLMLIWPIAIPAIAAGTLGAWRKRVSARKFHDEVEKQALQRQKIAEVTGFLRREDAVLAAEFERLESLTEDYLKVTR